MVPDPDNQAIRLTFSSGQEKDRPADSVMKWVDDFHVAVVVYPHDEPFEIVTAMPTGAARRLNTVERIREVLSDANDQFKNGITYKAAPCLLMIFQDGLDVPDEAVINSALYGNLQYSFPKGKPRDGKLILDQDGAWNSTKNRTTSAVVFLRNGADPLIIHNYWAERPLQPGVFSSKEISVSRKGTFQEADFSAKPTRLQSVSTLRGYVCERS